MSTETQIAESYIYSTVAAELSGTSMSGCPIWPDVAPPGTAWPCVVFSLQSPRPDKMVVGDDRILCELLYQVKVIGNTRKEDIDDYAAAIDRCLHGYVGTAGGVLGITRENPIDYVETSDTGMYQHLGGLYKCIVQPPQTLVLRFTNGTAPYVASIDSKVATSTAGKSCTWDSAVGGELAGGGTWVGRILDGTYTLTAVDSLLKMYSGTVTVRKNRLTPSIITLV